MKPWQDYEMQARRAIEDRGFTVLDANIVFRANCPNIDAIVFGRRGASYVQIKSSTKPAGADTVVVDGSVWTREQLYESASISNTTSLKDFFATKGTYVIEVQIVADNTRLPGTFPVKFDYDPSAKDEIKIYPLSRVRLPWWAWCRRWDWCRRLLQQV